MWNELHVMVYIVAGLDAECGAKLMEFWRLNLFYAGEDQPSGYVHEINRNRLDSP